MRTIRSQLTRKLTASFLVLLLAAGVGVYVSTRAALLEQFDATLRTKALVVVTVTGPDEDEPGVEVTERFSREFNRRFPDDLFELWHKDGRPIERSASLKQADLPIRVGTGETAMLWNVMLPSGHAGRAIGMTFAPPPQRRGSPIGDLILVVASDRTGLDRTLQTLAVALGGCGGLLLAVTPLLVPRLLKRQLAPLHALADQAATIGADSLASRFAVDGLPDEIAPISLRLNDLLARLEASFERERQFSGDLAHELRTPIAELRSLAEFSLKWPGSRDPTTDRDALAIAQRMEGIVTKLLALHRGEGKLVANTLLPIAVAPAVQRLFSPFAERAAAKRLRIDWAIPPDLVVNADAVLFDAIVTNLFENAVDYTPDGGTVSIAATSAGTPFGLHVTNSTESLTPMDVSHFFDRLWRKDTSRSDDRHNGLGLPLARAFAEAIGWRLDAQFLDGTDIRLTMSE